MARLHGFTKQQVLDVYHTMVLARKLDDKMMTMLKQGKAFFHMAVSYTHLTLPTKRIV